VIDKLFDRINLLNALEKRSSSRTKSTSRWLSSASSHFRTPTTQKSSSSSFSSKPPPPIFTASTSRATSTSPGAFGPTWVLHALLDINVDLFMGAVERVETEIQVLDDLVLILGESDQSDLLRRLGAGRKRIAGKERLPSSSSSLLLFPLTPSVSTI
jgi:hypothetical protein